MSKIDDAINSLQEDRREAIHNDSFTAATVTLSELTTLLNWAVRVRERNPFLIGDKVKLKQYEDEEGEQPTEGLVVALATGAVIVDAGEYTGLFYFYADVERIEE